MYEVVVRGGTVVTPLAATSADVAVDNGTISAIGKGLQGRRTIDAIGKLIFPGAVDAHTHMALPVAGTQSSDDFHSGTIAAACGGVTTIIDFTVGTPDTSIPEEIEKRLEEIEDAVIDVALHAEVIGWDPADEEEFREAIRRGVTSFKFYTAYESSGRRTLPATMRRAFALIAELGGVALVHAEDEGLIRSIENNLSPEDRSRMRTLAVARPALCEQRAIAHVGRLAAETGCAVHIVHVSSALGLVAVRVAKEAGARLTAETCPQYLVLTAESYDRMDGHLFSASPALRTEADQRALWDGLRRRELDLVATDHCPFTRRQKAWRGSYTDLPYGLPGVETLLPLLYSEGVAKGVLQLSDIPRLLSEGPARVHGLHPQKGAIEVGSDADLVIFDPDATWEIAASDLHMDTDFSPYEGWRVTGRIESTIARGDVVVENGEPNARTGRGRFLIRGRR
ncbi:dihydropyrimidinase [Candidatus Bipolaricaulota bacterium]|nr:dihydropyrimidinase [Candidatus Bipolaricaulota bacterium]